MKLHRFFFEILVFFAIFIALILPPITNVQRDTLLQFQWNLPLNYIFLGTIALFIFLYEITQKKQNEISEKNTSNSIKTFILATIFTFISLFIIAFILESVAFLTKQNQQNVTISPINSKKELFYCILKFCLAAFYEEVIYRLYLPEQLKRFFKNTQNKITQIYIPEIITIILFALGHKYLGIFAVINACIACVILRICYLKTKNIFAGTIAHFMYNFVSLLLFLI